MAESPKVPKKKQEREKGKTDPNRKLRGGKKDGEEKESKLRMVEEIEKKRRKEKKETKKSQNRRKWRKGKKSQERMRGKRTVQETDTGGQVRKALRQRRINVKELGKMTP